MTIASGSSSRRCSRYRTNSSDGVSHQCRSSIVISVGRDSSDIASSVKSPCESIRSVAAPAGSSSRPISARTVGGAPASSASRRVAGCAARSASSSLRATPNATPSSSSAPAARSTRISRARAPSSAASCSRVLPIPAWLSNSSAAPSPSAAPSRTRSISRRGASRSSNPDLPRCARPRRSGASRTGMSDIYTRKVVFRALFLGCGPGANAGDGRDPCAVEHERAHVHLVIEPGSDPIRGTLTGPDGQPRGFGGWIELVEAIELVRLSSDPRAEGPPTDTVNRCVGTQFDPVRSARGR